MPRDLYVRPPKNGSWNWFEKIARGSLPDLGDQAGEAHATAEGKGKGKETAESSRKGKGKGKGKKRPAEEVDHAEPLGQLSFEEAMKKFTSSNPFALRMAHLSKHTPTAYYVWSDPISEHAQRRAMEHMHLLQDTKGYIGSYFPPPSLFYTVTSLERLFMYTRSVILLLPFLVKRVARGSKRFSGKQWREILNGEYWRLRWPKEKRGEFSMEGDFWRYGGEEIFGEEAAGRIARGEWTPTLGKLLCGHPPSREMIVDRGKVIHSLVQEVTFALNQWALLHQLSALAQGALKNEGFSEVSDGPVKHITPDFQSTTNKSKVMKLIREIVTEGEPVPEHGWPKIWCGLRQYELPARRRHVLAMHKFLLNCNDHASYFEGRPGWTGTRTLSEQQLGSFQEEKLDSVSVEYADRYAVSCLLAQQWPLEWMWLSTVVASPWYQCAVCRRIEWPFEGDSSYEDSDDD